MQLINTADLVLIGPGSEWFWSAVSGLVLAVTVVALYRQLRIQANESAIDQLTEFEAEWASERFLRNRLAILLELRDGTAPAQLSAGPAHFVFNFWERIGALCRRGRVDPKLLASVNGSVSEWWWTILRAYVMRHRVELGPTFGESFEWLNGVMAQVNRDTGVLGFDQIGDLEPDIASLEWRIGIEEQLRSSRPSSPSVSRRARPAEAAHPDGGYASTSTPAAR